MKFADEVRRAIIQKNKTLGIAMDASKATEEGESLAPFLEAYCENKKSDKNKKSEEIKASINSADKNSSKKNERFEFKPNARFQASYLDIFVEDAICHLTERAESFYRYALYCIILAILVLVGGIVIIIITRPEDGATLNTAHLIIKIFSALAIGGLVLVAAKGLLSLIRAFLHEATRLLERRHALRFGKLFFYLRLGQTSEAIDLTLTLKDIQEAFQWNKETSTAFLDMKPDVIADTIINQLARMPASVFDKIIEGYAAAKKQESETSAKK
jgi:hypothetical protein